MSPARAALMAAVMVVAFAAAKVLRFADEGRILLNPAPRAALHEIEDGHAADALDALETIAKQEEAAGTD